MSRSSNIELLRIVATFFILVLHCNGCLLNDFYNLTWASGDIAAQFCRPIVQAATVIAVDLFILISGYFSIKFKWKSLINLFSILFFYYVGSYLFASYLGEITFSWRGLLQQTMAFSRGNWFIQAYLFLMLLSPILNSFIQSCTKKSLRNYILVYLGLMFYFSCVHNSAYFYFNRGYSVTTFIGLYLIGRYLKLYLMEDLRKYSSLFIGGGYVFVVAMNALLYYFNLSNRLVHYGAPFVILSAVLFFLLFERIKIQNKLVNYVASSCLAVFIVHICAPAATWLRQMNYTLFIENSYWMYMLKLLPLLMGFFCIVILLDKVRMFLVRPILKLIK